MHTSSWHPNKCKTSKWQRYSPFYSLPPSPSVAKRWRTNGLQLRVWKWRTAQAIRVWHTFILCWRTHDFDVLTRNTYKLCSYELHTSDRCCLFHCMCIILCRKSHRIWKHKTLVFLVSLTHELCVTNTMLMCFSKEPVPLVLICFQCNVIS